MTSPFERALGEELYAAAVRDQQRRRRRSVRALAASVVAVVAGGAVLAWPSSAAADVEVRIEDGMVVVHINDDSATPGEVLDALEDEGFTASVVGLTTGPSGVGRFVRVTARGGQAQPSVADEVGTAFRTFSLPEGWSGDLSIGVGIVAEDGDAYDALSDPFAADEPLHCAGVLGQPLVEVADRLTDLTVTVRAFEGDLLVAEEPLAQVLASSRSGWMVTSGVAISAEAVTLTVVEQTDVDETGC